MLHGQYIGGLLAAGRHTAEAATAMLKALGSTLLHKCDAFNKRGFLCRIEQFTGEGPVGRDQYFRVQMTGRIPTPEDNYSTDVQVEMTDITESVKSPEPVLSTDPQFHLGKDATFHWRACNGTVPKRNAVLARWITVAEIPCHILRFACRGRRRLLFSVSVLSTQTDQVLTHGHQKIDYVNCTDGFRERLKRKVEVLKSTLRLAAIAGSHDGQVPTEVRQLMQQWIESKASAFPAALRLNEALAVIDKAEADVAPASAADRLLAWGEQTDKEEAMILSLRSAGCRSMISQRRFLQLIEIAGLLGTRREFFLAQAQQCFLACGCEMENPAALLGIDAAMNTEQILKRLTDEYRRWNSRVTHPDAEIRLQADRMLTLIADLRSRQLNPSL